MQPASRTRPSLIALAALVAVTALCLAAGLSACGGTSASSATVSSGSPAAATGPVSATDDTGTVVSLDNAAAKVVSVAPADTEIAFAIGAGPKIVGDTTYCDYPAEAKTLPKVGDFANPSIEKIVALRPDLVLAAGGIQEGFRKKLENLGVKVYVVDPQTLEQLYADLSNLGTLTGVKSQAQAVVDGMKKTVADVQAKLAGVTDKPKVFFEVYGKPLMTAGTGTFIDQIITLAGGQNIGEAAGPAFPYYSAETLFKEDPAIYIAPRGSMADPGVLAQRAGYDQLSAVKNGRVFVIDDNIIVRPGPRLAQGLMAVAQMIHPEIFGTPSPSPAATASPTATP